MSTTNKFHHWRDIVNIAVICAASIKKQDYHTNITAPLCFKSWSYCVFNTLLVQLSKKIETNIQINKADILLTMVTQLRGCLSHKLFTMVLFYKTCAASRLYCLGVCAKCFLNTAYKYWVDG